MLPRFDGTSGYFNDVPYFTPVETTVFYEAVQNCRLHKLPGHLMVSPRSIPFFVKSGTVFADALGEKFKATTGTRTTSAGTVFPEFKTDFSSTQPLFKKSGSDYVVIRETCLLADCGASNEHTQTVLIKLINTTTINQIWTNLLFLINGIAATPSKFRIEYVDISLGHSNGYGECLLSLLLSGVASILHFYSKKGHHQAVLEAVTIELVVLNTPEGASVADKLQFYAENKLKLSVTRTDDNNFSSSYEELISQAQCLPCCDTDWLETVCSEAVDAHEMLCDEENEPQDNKLRSPTILLVVPHIAAVRSTLVNQILDSYSSEPLRVQSEREWSFDELAKSSPVVFVCSATWLVSQMSVSMEENLLSKVDVKVVIHGGFCEIANTIEEEIVRCTIALQNCGVKAQERRILQLQNPPFFKRDVLPNSSATEHAVHLCGGTLLLLFRRFVMRFSPVSKQPFVSLPRNLFCTEQAWIFFNSTVYTLQAAGIMASSSDVSPEVLELSVLGRFLSFHFRIGDVQTRHDSLTLADGKAILWAFLLRQPLSVPQEVVKGRHTFHTWVETAVAEFCSEHQLIFEFQNSIPRSALVEQLARFGFGDGAVQNRVHYILSSPNGTRFPLRPHLTGSIPTVCRGWYEQAPLNAGLALEKKEVNVVCLPPKSAYCEMESIIEGSNRCLQSPLELSYPIIVAHSVFHISLHNICVFSETAESSAVMPLPANLLESGVMHFLMSGLTKANAGLWLDGVMNEITPSISDSSVLAPLTLKGKRHIQYCEREAFTRKKRRLAAETEKTSDTNEFRGVLPRTAAERNAVEELVELIKSVGREKAEKIFRGKKGFNFLEASHEVHPFYLYSLKSGF
ncbi:hypothetical protein ABB37_01371 [Leptomonas pyrrhocoris]|uniref:Uncharacterized protein n=1 Tax=Leptomonas pyrrhocoris TaxID=157538 RepID=A0A0N0VH90_LEPPY|nr:hypothetical protein ABB37_01371 [Leptomonas pyrrhocoris]KPA84921.1 hypothetical protein ABB37_01371 [Leptomonas pyrrhocoris]|eukprot:XP_015663360.1 hypothetical protein ABB37_01371 [Leptomonas pyrrhocoris]